MTAATRPQKIEMIRLDKINVLNPRTRNKRQHLEIVENIQAVGLKRPITVRQRPNDAEMPYDLVCGEGRLEAFRVLGKAEIPAVVIEAEESDCLVMSLVENIARRQHRPIDLMQEIGSLHKRGYTDSEIAQKIGCTPSWVNMIVVLLERGEERLLAAVETGVIPLHFAIDIARAKSEEAQTILLEAYEAGKLKGKKLGTIRRILDQRLRRRKAVPDSGFSRRNSSRRITPAELMRIYQREADKQRILVKKSDFTQSKLLFIVEALKDLLADDAFNTLLRAEGLGTMPRALAGRIAGEMAS
jgi:ParB family chromosome partitioning protein